jgi:pilus assembly protein CpaC
LNTSVAANKDVTPLLGDLPVIGPIFRTVHYSRKETEMVVLVTPHLVEPLNPADVQRLPGEDWQFPDELSLFANADLGGERDPHRAPQAPSKDRPAPRYHGQYGFIPVAAPAAPAPPLAVQDESQADSND